MQQDERDEHRGDGEPPHDPMLEPDRRVRHSRRQCWRRLNSPVLAAKVVDKEMQAQRAKVIRQFFGKTIVIIMISKLNQLNISSNRYRDDTFAINCGNAVTMSNRYRNNIITNINTVTT